MLHDDTPAFFVGVNVCIAGAICLYWPRALLQALRTLTLKRDHGMETYTLPREAFNMFEQTLGGRENAEILARTLETVIGNIQQRAKEESLEQNRFCTWCSKMNSSRNS
jgi:hypothetical protein